MKFISYLSNEKLADATELLLRETLAKPGNLMLSGGRSPYVVYNRIADNPCVIHPERILFMGDERMVPPDSTKNNFYNLKPMIRALECEAQAFGTDTTLPIEQAAKAFAEKLESMKVIDLALLGIGADGHTCGFFTLEQAADVSGLLTLYTDRPDGMQGVSATPALLQRVRRIVVLAPGKSKRAVLQTLRSAPQTIVAGVVYENHPCVEVWTDLELE